MAEDNVEAARQAVENARRVAQERRQQAEEARQQIERQRDRIPDPAARQNLSKYRGIQGRQYRQQLGQARDELSRNISEIDSYKQNIDSYEQDIQQVEGQIKSYDRYKADVEQAKRVAAGISDPRGLSDQGRAIYARIQEGNDAAVEATLKDIESQVSLTDSERREIFRELQENLGRISNSELNARIGTIISPSIRRDVLPEEVVTLKSESIAPMQGPQLQQVEINPNTGRPYGTVESVPEPKGFLARTQASISRKRAQAKQDDNQLAGALTGVGSTALTYASLPGTAIRTITRPVTTARNAWGFLTTLPKNYRNIGESIGTSLREEPGYATGIVLSEVAAAKGIGQTAKLGTKALYQAADLPKVNTNFVSQQLVNDGGSAYLRTVAISDVKGAAFSKRVLTGSMTQTQVMPSVSGLDMVRSATVGVQREQGLLRKRLNAWSAPRKFGAADIGIVKSGSVNVQVGSVQGVPAYRSYDVNIFGSFGKVANKGKRPIYYATTGASKQFGELEAVRAVSKPIRQTKAGLSLGRGTQQIRGIVTKPRSSYDLFFGGGAQKTVSGSSAASALASQKSAINSIIKANVIEKVSSNMGKVSSVVGATAGLVPKASASTKTVAANTLDVKPAQSLWYGTGQYEKTNEVAITAPKVAQNNRQVDWLGSGSGQKTKQSQQTKQSISLSFKQPQANRGSQISWIGLGARSKQQQRLGQRQAQAQAIGGFGMSTRAARSTFRPQVSYSTRGGKVVQVDYGRYVVFVKRFGQNTIIGEAATLADAKRMLASNLTTTLGASGFVTEKRTGQKQKLNDLWGGMFTSSKRDPFRLVQRREKRLGSRSEVNEIWGFKRNAPKRSKSRRPKKVSWW